LKNDKVVYLKEEKVGQIKI